DRVPPARRDAGAGEYGDRPRILAGAALAAPPGPGRDRGGRDPRCGHGRARARSGDDRPPALHLAPRQRRHGRAPAPGESGLIAPSAITSRALLPFAGYAAVLLQKQVISATEVLAALVE